MRKSFSGRIGTLFVLLLALSLLPLYAESFTITNEQLARLETLQRTYEMKLDLLETQLADLQTLQTNSEFELKASKETITELNSSLLTAKASLENADSSIASLEKSCQRLERQVAVKNTLIRVLIGLVCGLGLSTAVLITVR